MKPIKPISGTGQTANLDRILASEEELTPSSGFVASVMDRVREEAAAPQPIPFPWKRALPGMVIAAAVLVWCAVKLVQMGIAAARTPMLVELHPSSSMIRSAEDAGWVAAALGVSLLSWLLARRMVGRSGLI
jgi:hypothetical protein